MSLSRRDGKPAVVEFWSSTCNPCTEKLELLWDLQEKYGADRLDVVGLNIDRDEETFREFAKSNNRLIRSAFLGIRNPVIKKWGVRAYPTIFIVDGLGRFVWSQPNMPLNLIEFCLGRLD